MSALMDATELRQHIETDLSDDALETIIASEDAEISARYGDPTTATETRLGNGNEFLLLAQPAQSITSVTMYDFATSYPLPPDGGVAAEYWQLIGSDLLQRVGTCWEGRVTVVYVPVDSVSQRVLVLIQLCKLAIAYSGYSNQNNPDGGESPLQYNQERERLLRSLASKSWMFA